jgi:hypothetical protein
MLVDELEGVAFAGHRWESAENYCDVPARVGMDRVEVSVPIRLGAGA